jgi:sugar/nucleoside kinase (ribokinase family)
MTHKPSSLLVVGSVAIDDLDGPFGVRPDVLGGSASYFSVAASLLAPQSVQLVAVIGDDFPAAHVELLRHKGVELAGLEKVPGKTFRWVGKYADDLASRTTLDTQLGVFADFRPKLNEAHRAAELLFLGNIDPVLQLDVLEQVKKPALVACDTMNFWIGGKPTELKRTLSKVDILLLNDEEARQLAGQSNLVKAVAAIRAMGPRGIIVKRGDAGALLFHEGGVFAAPAFPLENVVDPTGCGDTFAGGFMGYLARVGVGQTGLTPAVIKRAMVFGSTLASFCVEDVGLGRLRELRLDDVAKRFKAFYELTQFEHIEL